MGDSWVAWACVCPAIWPVAWAQLSCLQQGLPCRVLGTQRSEAIEEVQ